MVLDPADPELWRLEKVSLGPARLHEITDRIPSGVTAVLGWSGAGKTSLLNLLARFEKPQSGELHGNPRVAWVPQNGGLWPHCTVRAHLRLAMKTPKGSARDTRVEMLLAAFDLGACADARPSTLSLGEQARLAVARALAQTAEVLVMDEPLAHVDPARLGKYWGVIRDHLASTGASLVFSTHLPEIALGEAEFALCLHAGRVRFQGKISALYDAPPDQECLHFLGPGNWLEAPDVWHWLNRRPLDHPCLRPEKLGIERAEDGAMIIRSARFFGSYAEAELQNPCGEIRRFFHRPLSANFQPGERVRLFLQVLLAVCFLIALGSLSACQRSGSERILTARNWHTWQLPPEGATLPTPRSVATGRGGETAVLDTAGRVLIYDATGTLLRHWHMLDVKIGKPEGIVVLQDGRVVVCDTHYHRIVWFDSEGHWLKDTGRQGREAGQFIYPVGICKDAAENLYVCEYGGNDRVQKFSREGKWLASFGSFGTADGQFQRPSGLAWHEGNLYVADAINNRILIFSDAGIFRGLLGETNGASSLDLRLPYDLRFGPDDLLYVIEYGAGRLSRIDLNGHLLGRFGHSGSGEGEFATPWGLAVDEHLRFHVADTKNRRLVIFEL